MAVEIDGLEELKRRLREIPREMQAGANSPVNFGLLKAGNVVRDAAKDLVAVKSGKTRDSIKNLKKTKAQIKASGNDNPGRRIVPKGREHVAYWLEYGTGAFFSGSFLKSQRKGAIRIGKDTYTSAIAPITPSRKQVLFNKESNEVFASAQGQPPQPFMRPALERSWRKAVDAFAQGFESKLKRLEKKNRGT